jgi:hypothetical protein
LAVGRQPVASAAMKHGPPIDEITMKTPCHGHARNAPWAITFSLTGCPMSMSGNAKLP